MNIREAMDVIHGALDCLYKFYKHDEEREIIFEEIGDAEAVLEELVQKEEQKPKQYFAVCPNCGNELDYDTFQYDTCYEEKAFFLADGSCPHCEKNFTWQETFEQTKIEFNEETDE